MFLLHNRYAIYGMKGKRLKVKLPRMLGGKTINGVVSDVHRNIMTDEIELRVGRSLYRIKEPDLIVEKGKVICFIYGDPYKLESTDAEVFHEWEEITSRGGTIDDALKDTKISDLDIVRFFLEEKDGPALPDM